MTPLFELSIPLYLEQRRIYEDDLDMIAATQVTDSKILFEASATQIMQALHSDMEHEALDSQLKAWRLQTEKIQPIMTDLFYYWHEDELWKKDQGKAALDIDRRLSRHLEQYTQKRDALLGTMSVEEERALTHRKEMLGTKHLTAEVEVIDALLALNTLHTQWLSDPTSGDAQRARERYMTRYKVARRAAQRVEKPTGNFVLPGADAHIDHMRAYNEHLDAMEADLAKPATRLALISHLSTLHSAYHDTMTTYYTTTLNEEKMKAINHLKLK